MENLAAAAPDICIEGEHKDFEKSAGIPRITIGVLLSKKIIHDELSQSTPNEDENLARRDFLVFELENPCQKWREEKWPSSKTCKQLTTTDQRRFQTGTPF